MASNQTEHYGLSQWAADDSFLREEFNADHRKIDQELSKKCVVTHGSYIGAQASNNLTWMAIPLGFRPQAVLVVAHEGTNPYYLANMAVQLASVDCPAECLEITEDGFQVRGALQSQGSIRPYHYIACRWNS